MPSDGSAVVLLHGLNASGNAWQDVAPLLRTHHEVYAPTAMGHRGGPPVQRRPATIRDVVDWTERYLDEQDLQRPHLVGHSMGGFVAIELARRGRAASVCAFAPGGFWASGDGLRGRTMSGVQKGRGNGLPAATHGSPRLKSSVGPRLWFQTAACHGDRISAERGVQTVDDFLECTAELKSSRPTTSRSHPWTLCHARSLLRGRRRTYSFLSRPWSECP
jgi:pimeloyl-ACP methyl ester carboxylesterase